MARAYKPTTKLNALDFSPDRNPLAELAEVKTKSRMVRTGKAEMLANTTTGEITHTALVHQLQIVDSEHFVKIFAAGVIAMFELSRTAQKVFTIVLKNYQSSPLTGGYSDTVDLFWFDEKLSGQKIGLGQSAFNTGLRELIDKQFLAPRMPNSYWVNGNLFFRGDRVMFIKEYRKQATNAGKKEIRRDPKTVDFINGKTDAEKQP